MHSLMKELIDLRIASGLNQKDLAERLADDEGAFPRESVNRIERDKQRIRLEEAAAWATACGARLVLVREGDELAGLAEDEKALVLALRDMTRLEQDDRRQLAARFVACLPHMAAMAFDVIRPSVEAACGSSRSRVETAIKRETG